MIPHLTGLITALEKDDIPGFLALLYNKKLDYLLMSTLFLVKKSRLPP